MKTIKSLALIFLGGILAITTAFAQNYKAPTIDASCKFTDGKGVKTGTVTMDGIMDEKGIKTSSIDSEGNLIDTKSVRK